MLAPNGGSTTTTADRKSQETVLLSRAEELQQSAKQKMLEIGSLSNEFVATAIKPLLEATLGLMDSSAFLIALQDEFGKMPREEIKTICTNLTDKANFFQEVSSISHLQN